MYSFHGWFGLAETTSEADVGGLDGALVDMRPLLEQFEPHRSQAEVRALNGQAFLLVNGLLNREVNEASTLDDLLSFLTVRLPGSFGLLYDRNDEWTDGEFARSFRVRVLARGAVTIRSDPFMSPWQPTIEG